MIPEDQRTKSRQQEAVDLVGLYIKTLEADNASLREQVKELKEELQLERDMRNHN